MNYQQMLDSAIGLIPNSTIDVDAVVARERRRLRRNRIAGVATALLLLAAVGAAAFDIVAVPVNRPAVVDTAASAPTAAEDRTARLTAAMRAAVLAAAPDAVLGGPFVPAEGLHSDTSFLANAQVRVANREGVVGIWLVSRQNESCDEVSEATDCIQTTGPGGEPVVSWSEDESRYACAVRTEVTSVCVIHGEYGSEPALTAYQMRAIALDPALTLYP